MRLDGVRWHMGQKESKKETKKQPMSFRQWVESGRHLLTPQLLKKKGK